MRRYRENNQELVDSQQRLRKLLLTHLFEFDISDPSLILDKEHKIKSEITTLVKSTKNTDDEAFFKSYQHIISSLFHTIRWGQKELSGTEGSSNNYKALKANIDQVDLGAFDYLPDFKKKMSELIELISSIENVKEIRTITDRFIKIPFPTIHNFQSGNNRFGSNNTLEKDESIKPEIIIISIQFTLDDEPWAHPQILKPEELYNIKGNLILNKWPEGFDSLILKPVSTSSNNWFDLSLPEVSREKKLEYNIAGQIVFKYPQSSFDEPIAIRLLAYFKNAEGKVEYPTLIGYDQLIAKVLDPNSTKFTTGFKKMNKTVFDITTQIEKDLAEIDKEEKNDFLHLLNGIINYQGFCLLQGIYKGVSKIKENDFRDKIIQHLIAIPYLGENISKEAHLSGGRIEIDYKGIIAELKVETSISDRDKLIEKYGKQPVAYASGNTKQLSILCILDLTEKISPPAAPQNNIKLFTPEVHGFENSEPEYPSRVVLIIIDGNTKNPSDYSK